LNNYYLLGFTPPDPNDTHYREIDVRVSRPGVTLRYRRGYTAALPAAVNTPKNLAPMAADVAGVLPKTDLRLRLSATALGPARSDGTSPIAVTMEAHGDAARITSADGWLRDSFKYELVAVDLKRKKPVMTRSEQRDVSWRPSIPQAGDVAYSVTTEISLPPGLYQLRASGESAAMKTDGSVYLVVDVPDTHASPLTLGGLLLGYVSGPIAAVASGEAAALPFLPTADRSFLTSDVLHLLCDFSGGAGMGDVDFHIEAIDQSGHAVRTATKRITAGDAPRLDVKLSLDGFAPGPYLIKVTATSGVARDTREVGITVR
jgi:hypothetical protein